MKSAWPSWKRAETASADTNILVYAVAQDAGVKTEVARTLIRELALRRGVLTLQALGEFYFNVTKKFKIDSVRAATWVEDWQAAFTVAVYHLIDALVSLDHPDVAPLAGCADGGGASFAIGAVRSLPHPVGLFIRGDGLCFAGLMAHGPVRSPPRPWLARGPAKG